MGAADERSPGTRGRALHALAAVGSEAHNIAGRNAGLQPDLAKRIDEATANNGRRATKIPLPFISSRRASSLPCWQDVRGLHWNEAIDA